MLREEVERLRAEHTDRLVVVDAGRAELARFAGRKGQIRTINMNGRALVQFEGADRAWYDIALADLKPADPPPA